MPKKKRLLVVEDNVGDQLLFQEIFSSRDPDLELLFFKDGQEALSFLESLENGEVDFKADLITLDINLPKIDGFGLLSFIKGSDKLKAIPVVIFSTSSYYLDKRKAMDLGADVFVTKPSSFSEYRSVLNDLYDLKLADVH
jgi:CheY-like chemotaxis protein